MDIDECKARTYGNEWLVKQESGWMEAQNEEMRSVE
jgi:hypothetical protein